MSDPFGRQSLVDGLAGLVGRSRLVTITGPAGVGKSHTARAVVAVLSSPRLVWVAVDASRSVRLDALVARELIGAQFAARDPSQAVVDAIGAAEVLLVLDGVDQVSGVGEVVEAWLAACTGLRVLVTSQRRLASRRERVVAVEPLAVDGDGDVAAIPAVAFFVEAAVAAGIRIDVTESSTSLQVIGERCGGLPWALLVTSGWLSVYTAEELAEVLATSSTLFTGGAVDMAERHRRLDELVEWSTRDLTADEFELLVCVWRSCRAGWHEAFWVRRLAVMSMRTSAAWSRVIVWSSGLMVVPGGCSTCLARCACSSVRNRTTSRIDAGRSSPSW